MKSWFKVIISIFYLFLTGCSNSEQTVSPKTSNIVESVFAAGIVKSENQYEVFAEVNGKIENVFVKEGDSVNLGDPLFQLENNTTRLSTDNARANSFANDFRRNQSKLSEAGNAVALAQKKVTNDSILLVRQRALWQQNIGSKIQLEQQELNYENSRANLKKAKVNFEEINRQLKLASEQSTNNLKIAQDAENNLIIRSELNGIVYKINATKSEYANSTKPLAVLGQRNFLIEFNVDELDIVKIQIGQKVLLRMDSYEDQVFEAEVSFVYPMMDERTRAFRVEALFTKAPKVLYPNLTLEANIIISEKKDVLTIPTAYLIDESSVLLEDGSIRQVEIGLKNYNSVEIISGLDKSTKIRLPEK